ncbi:hypothetical protein [Streptomyces sp. NPDC002825]|uniref:hypothetical protein n=1 Tax=Streptomyces sp. NPDC002825 TaxID=3154666 RepID=UPI0033262F8C
MVNSDLRDALLDGADLREAQLTARASRRHQHGWSRLNRWRCPVEAPLSADEPLT